MIQTNRLVTLLMATTTLAAAAGCSEKNPYLLFDSGPAKLDGVKTKDGNVAKPDGKVAKPDGKVTQPDGKVTQPDGKVTQPDGKVTKPDLAPLDSRPADTLTPPDVRPQADTVPWPPDMRPWQCKTNLDCDDKQPCTTDTCTPQKTCKNTVMSGYCLVGKTCYKNGQTDPTNSCSVCSPTLSTSSWTSKIDGVACNNDGHSCTVDACKKGACTHTLAANYCFIDSACRPGLTSNPKNECQFCQPTISTKAWTSRRDGASCKADSLSCTSDVCKKGSCTHDVSSGCLINGACVNEGQADPKNACQECRGAVSRTTYSYVAGKPCSSGSGVARFCFAKKCKGFNMFDWEPSGSREALLRSVARMPADKKFWAAGQYDVRVSGGGTETRGVLLDLETAAASKPNASTLVATAARDLHHNLAVGMSGRAWFNDGKKWVANTAFDTKLAKRDRYAVWGRDDGTSKVVYHVGGPNSGALPGALPPVVRCTLNRSSSGGIGSVGCTAQSGVRTQDPIAFFHGTTTSTGGQGPLWAAVQGSNTEENIYYKASTTVGWSTNGPHGCRDSGSNPCANTPSHTYNLGGQGTKELWMVGSSGMILRYDGTTWAKVQNAFSNQGSYSITAVYSIPSEKLVIFAVQGGSTWNPNVRLVTYNTAAKKWYGPITVVSGSSAMSGRIYDISSDGTTIWMVGTRRSGGVTSGREKTWYLRLK